MFLKKIISFHNWEKFHFAGSIFTIILRYFIVHNIFCIQNAVLFLKIKELIAKVTVYLYIY